MNEIKTYLAGWFTTRVIKNGIPFGILFFLVWQCNRGCGKEPQLVGTSTFDYTAIAVSLPNKDTVPVDTMMATEDLRKVIPGEMIEFAKAHSGLFAKYLSTKYEVSNGYVEKIE